MRISPLPDPHREPPFVFKICPTQSAKKKTRSSYSTLAWSLMTDESRNKLYRATTHCLATNHSVAADEIARTPFTVFDQQHSWTGNAHAPLSRHIQRVGLGPRATGRRERLDGRQEAGAEAETAHGEERLAEHREAKAARKCHGAWDSGRVRAQHKPLRSPPASAARVSCSSRTDDQ